MFSPMLKTCYSRKLKESYIESAKEKIGRTTVFKAVNIFNVYSSAFLIIDHLRYACFLHSFV